MPPHKSHKSTHITILLRTLHTGPDMISVPFPPPHLRITLVGFIETNNGHRCDLHPDGCRDSLVIERADHGVGMEFRLRMKVADELTCYIMKSDGTEGCRVAFAMKEYAAGKKGSRLDGAIVRIVDVFLPGNPNRAARRFYHHNCSYAVGEIVSLSEPIDKS